MGLVPYNLSPIQQGIQYGHAVVEYALQHFDDSDFQKWANNDKTFIIFNGGTTSDKWLQDGSGYAGSLNNYRVLLNDKNVKLASFYEPDLGEQLTAVVFLVDDRVWDKTKWPDYVVQYNELGLYREKKLKGEDFTSLPSYSKWVNQFDEHENRAMDIVWLREFLKGFKFA